MKRVVAISIVLVMLLAGVGTVSAAIVTNGGFEDPALPGETDYQLNMVTGLPGWIIGPGNVDVIKEYWTPSELLQSLDLSGGTRGTISQTITGLDPTETYQLTFMMAGNPAGLPNEKKVMVYWDNRAFGPYSFFNTGSTTLNNMGWEKNTIPHLTSSGTSTIKFEDVSEITPPPYYGVALDDIVVEVQEDSTPVPEFPSIALPAALIVGLIGAVLVIQKSKDN
ncbi:MAG: DUF642 domain-containing protein [Methanoregula sp.]|nr:DUF642 domain-containing protein [Methanoregula sp.]